MRKPYVITYSTDAAPVWRREWPEIPDKAILDKDIEELAGRDIIVSKVDIKIGEKRR